MKTMNNNKGRYLKSIFTNIDILKDIEFAVVKNIENENEKLLFDVYTPVHDSEKKRPAIIWIHGGGFKKGIDKSQDYIVNLAMEFAKKGYVCFSINYRVREDPENDVINTLKDAIDDAILGINFIIKKSKIYNIDKKQIIIAGGSAGGVTGTNLFLINDDFQKKNKISAFVNLWGSPPSFAKLGKMNKDFPSTIIIHGNKDQIVDFKNSENLIEELKQNNIDCILYPINGAEHTPKAFMKDVINYISDFLYKKIKNR